MASEVALLFHVVRPFGGDELRSQWEMLGRPLE